MTHSCTKFELYLTLHVCVSVYIYVHKCKNRHSALHLCLWGSGSVMWREGERGVPQGHHQPWQPQAVLQHRNRSHTQPSQLKHMPKILIKKKDYIKCIKMCRVKEQTRLQHNGLTSW